jgi:hypothetical protein
MDLRRLRAGEWIAALSGLALLVALFMPWYDGESGWEAFTVLDLILAVLALAALAIPVVTAGHRVPAVPLAHQSLVTLAGMAELLLVLIRVANLPGDAEGRDWGLWLGLASTLGIAAGSVVAMRDERLSPAGGHTDVSGVPVAAPREIEQIPAPRPEARP